MLTHHEGGGGASDEKGLKRHPVNDGVMRVRVEFHSAPHKNVTFLEGGGGTSDEKRAKTSPRQ